MAVVRINEAKIENMLIKSTVNNVLITSPEQLLELADKLAVGLKDAILEFFVAKKTVPEEVFKQYDDVEGPDEDLEAGMDNEYFEDSGEPV